jgi:hypothetical protein
VLQEPVSRGRAYSYAASQDSLAIAASRALQKQGLTVLRDTVVGSSRLLLASRGTSFTSWGALDRVAITPAAIGTEVRVLSRPRASLDFLHQDPSPRLFLTLDRELDGSAVRTFQGDRVRLILRAPDNRRLTGIVLAGDDTVSLKVQARDQTLVIPAGDLAGLSVSRGSYGHAKEGGLIGSLVGGLVGLIAVVPESDTWAGVERAAGFMVGSLIGVVSGSLIGSAVRTEVWSEVPAPPRQ